MFSSNILAATIHTPALHAGGWIIPVLIGIIIGMILRGRIG